MNAVVIKWMPLLYKRANDLLWAQVCQKLEVLVFGKNTVKCSHVIMWLSAWSLAHDKEEGGLTWECQIWVAIPLFWDWNGS